MTECRSPELQDLLPDFAAELLDDERTARVRSHLIVCAACAEDAALLRVARRLRPPIDGIDVARIVASLPAPPGGGVVAPTRGPVQVGDTSGRFAPALPSRHERPARRQAVMGVSVWRLAATLGVIIAGGVSLVVARQGLVGIDPAARPPRVTTVAESVTEVGQGPRAIVSGLPGAAEGAPVVAARTVSVSYGDLGDYTADELQHMLDQLEQWDGATNEEPLPSSPMASPRGGTR